LSWKPSSSGSIKYRIYKGTSVSDLSILVDTTSTLSYLDRGLESWKGYYYAVRSVDTVGVQSKYSNMEKGVPNNIWWVSTSGDDKNIGSINNELRNIDSAHYHLRKNDTIALKSGTYNGNYTFNKKLTLLGVTEFDKFNKNQTKVILNFGNSSVGIRNNDTLFIKKLQLKNASTGIEVGGQIFMDSCYVTNMSAHGIYQNQTAGVLDIKNTVFESNGDGIYTFFKQTHTVESCVFRNNTTGVSMYNSEMKLNNSLFYKNNTAYSHRNDLNGWGKKSEINYSTIVYNNVGINTSEGELIYCNNSIIDDNNKSIRMQGTRTKVFLDHVFLSGGRNGIDSISGVVATYRNVLDSKLGLKDSFRLSNSSKAIGSGKQIVGINRDFEGNPRTSPIGSNPDLGAYESPFEVPGPYIDSVRTLGDTMFTHINLLPTNKADYFYLRYQDTSGQITFDSTKLSSTNNHYIVKNFSLKNGRIYKIQADLNKSTIGPSNVRSAALMVKPDMYSPSYQATMVDTNQSLKWWPSPYAEKYRVQLSSNSDFTSTLIDNIVAVDSFKPKGLKLNRTYYWRTLSMDSLGRSLWSDVFTYQTEIQKARIDSLRYTPTKVKLHFSIHDTFNIAKFYVYRDTSPNAFNLIDSVSATARVFVDSLVKPGLRYYYRLRVVNKQNVIGDFGVERALNILHSPTLIDPKNEQDSVFWTTTFAWSKTSKAQYSEFELYQIGGNDSLINRKVLNEDTLTVASLKQNRYHVWRIRALDSCGQSEWSDTFRMQTKVAPTNITKVQSYVAHIDLSWQLADTFNVKDYVIYRDTVVSGLTVLDSITYTGTTYRDSSLAAGVRYYYQIRVRNRQGAMSDPSPMRSASVLEAPILVKPVNMKTNESRNPVHDWQKVKYATKYRVKVSSDSQMVNLLANTLQTPNSFALSNLKYSTYYFWKVRAEDSTGYGAWSESRLYQTEVQTPILKMLSSKGNLVEINWELKDTINAASFLIFRDTVVNPQMVIDSISSSERSYFDTNITTNTRYYYSIVLKNRQHVKGSKSNVKAINVMREPTLIVPGDNKPNITTSLIFDWSSEKFANSYSIHVSTDSLFTNRVKDTSSSFSSVTMGVFKRNTNYFWRVRCEDTLGYGLWSKTFKYQTELDVPELTFIATENRRSTIKWVLNDTTNYANLNGFYIYRDTLPGAEKLIDSVNSDVLSYVDTTVKVSTMYYYRLKTRNRQNITSDFSNERRAAILNEPILITPYDSTFENKLVSTFKWIKQRYATDYQLQVSYDSIVSKPFMDLTVTDMDSMKLTLSRKNYFYYWKVRSIDSLGVSGWSNINKFQTELTRPSIDTTISGNKKIRIYWTSSDTQNIKNYRIYRDTTTSKPSFIASISNQFNKQNYDYLDSGLVNFKTYYYWISAVNYQNIESQKSLFKFNTTFNLAPVAQIIEDTAFEAVGRVDRVKRYFNQDGAIDKDGWIDSTVWFIDNIRVSNHDTLKYLFRQGTTKVSAVVYDNDLATDTNTFYVDQLTYRKNFRAGIVAGISIYDKNEIYVADTSLNSFGLGEVVRIDSMGNTTFNYLVSQRIRTTPSFDFNGNMYLTNGVNLSTFTKSGAPYLNEIALGGLSFITPTIDSILGMVYIGLSNKKFFAIDASHGGKIKWDFTTDAPISAPAVVTAGRKLIFPDVSGNLYGFDITYSYKPKTGDDPNWKWTSNSDSILLAPAIDTFENIIVGTTSGKLMKLSFDTLGKINTKWSVNLKSRITTSAVIDAYGHVYVGCENGLLYCVKSSNGDTIWSFQTGARIVSTPTLNENSRLYVANINGDVFALDSAKRIMWYYNGHEPVVSHLAYLEGQLYISTLKGSLYGIYDNGIIEDITSAKNQVTKRSKILDVPKPIWGTFQGNNRRTGVQDWIFRLVPNKQADQNSIILFPNPSENSFVIESLFGINKIEFYENQGRLAYQSIFNKSTRVSFNNLDLSPGIYILKIFTERGTVIKRLIITGN
jgi:outer membrane protein assembly factor BamB